MPGKHFPALSVTEQNEFYWGTNVESVFSGAGKFTDEAKSAGHKLVSRITKLHYDWKYKFLHPTNQQVVERYNKKFRPSVYARSRRSRQLVLRPKRQRRPSSRHT